MIHVVAVVTAKPGKREEILQHFRANVPACRAEKGCIEYGPVVDAENALGFQTKIAAYLLALFCVFTALVFHSGPINVPDFPEGANGLLTMFNGLMMMKNLTIAGGFLVLAAFGPGSISVDARRGAPVVA